MNDEAFMELALIQARHAAALGEVPVGAVVVRHGEVIATGFNRLIESHDPTAHAEIVALRAAALAVGNYRLDDCELFVTLEPCAMCTGALLNARLRRVVFGASEPKTGAAGSVVNLFSLAQLNHQTEVEGGVLGDAGRALLQAFFRQRRAELSASARQRHRLRDDALRTPDAAFEGLPGYPWPAHYLSDLPALQGLRMHYLDEQAPRTQEHGRAPRMTYFCLHDSPLWSYAFHRLIPQLLRQGHRVVAPDLIGFGKSDKPKKEIFHTLGRHHQILVEMVQRLDLRDVVLVLPPGKGGLLGLTLPVAAPQRYRSLRVGCCECLPVTDDMPLSGGLLLWDRLVGRQCDQDMELCRCDGSLATSSEVRAAKEAPFPVSSFRAAARAFKAMPCNVDGEDGSGVFQRAERFWRAQGASSYSSSQTT